MRAPYHLYSWGGPAVRAPQKMKTGGSRSLCSTSVFFLFLLAQCSEPYYSSVDVLDMYANREGGSGGQRQCSTQSGTSLRERLSSWLRGPCPCGFRINLPVSRHMLSSEDWRLNAGIRCEDPNLIRCRKGGCLGRRLLP